ncbi:hypothetical protein QTP70_022210, partial [Hemibagrus guttatus]
ARATPELPAADYAIKFRTLAVQSGWNDTALLAVFREGLHLALQAEMACPNTNSTLSDCISTAVCLDNLRHLHYVSTRPRLQYRRTNRGLRSHRGSHQTHATQEGVSLRGVILLRRTRSPGVPMPRKTIEISENKAMDDYIKEALAAGHIRPSTSPAAAGFFFMGKKDGGLRPCINYSGLNAITVRYSYPLPLVPAALEQLQGASIFIKLDLLRAYDLVRIREGGEWKTAFHTTRGHYEYLVMPYGLTSVPAVFQSLINEIFKDLLNHFVIAYIDDILIYCSSLKEHIQHVRTVLTRLKEYKLYIKLEK